MSQWVAVAVDLNPSDLASDLAAGMLATPPGPELADQGLALCQRYEHTGRLRDLTEGIELVRRAIEYAVDPEWRARNEGNLGTALHRLYEHTHASEALDESIERFRSATACPVLNEYDRTFWLHDLAHALRDRYAQRSVRAPRSPGRGGRGGAGRGAGRPPGPGGGRGGGAGRDPGGGERAALTSARAGASGAGQGSFDHTAVERRR